MSDNREGLEGLEGLEEFELTCRDCGEAITALTSYMLRKDSVEVDGETWPALSVVCEACYSAHHEEANPNNDYWVDQFCSFIENLFERRSDG